MKMLNTRVKKNITLGVQEFMGRTVQKKKKIFWIVVPVFEYKQVMFCGILDNYSSFCTRKRAEIQLFKL